MNALDIDCQRLVGLVTRYLEGTAPDRDRVSFELHLVVCPSCLVHVDTMRRVVRAVGGLRGTGPGPEEREALLAALSGSPGRAP